MQLEHLLKTLDAIAPLSLAEHWDNVGLLVAPEHPREISTVLLTIDLTEAVLDEAIEHRADAILAYHPPVFQGLKRILPEERTGRLLLRLIHNHIAVYSPHTALDAVEGGVNDWLGDAFEQTSSRAIVPHAEASNPRVGQGRWLELAQAISADEAIARVKAHLELATLRVGLPPEPPTVRRVALCAGAGASVVLRASADLYLTGEMRHHDILTLRERGAVVVLTEHSNSERGYLQRLQARLEASAPELVVVVSQRDHDPLALA